LGIALKPVRTELEDENENEDDNEDDNRKVLGSVSGLYYSHAYDPL
jgi:hypothetical protein